MKRLLVTGATGFVGRALVSHFSKQRQFLIRAASRFTQENSQELVNSVIVEPLGPDTSWVRAVSEIDTIIHTAARVHVRNDHGADALAEFRRTNVAGTLALARQAAEAGVQRFVFLSSIKVNGERTEPGQPFCADDSANPVGAYAISKHEAEEVLWEIQQTTGMEIVIIRPTLVYGPGVKANFEMMMRWVHRGIPLPLAGIENRRSLISINNLVDFIGVCCINDAAANRTWLVSDGDDLSTTELLTQIGEALGRSPRLFRLPDGFLRTAASAIGRESLARRLLESLQVDTAATHEYLGWAAPQSTNDALRITAEHFAKGRCT